MIGEYKQLGGSFSFGDRALVQQVADGALDALGVGRFEPGDQVVLAVGQVRAVCADKVAASRMTLGTGRVRLAGSALYIHAEWMWAFAAAQASNAVS